MKAKFPGVLLVVPCLVVPCFRIWLLLCVCVSGYSTLTIASASCRQNWLQERRRRRRHKRRRRWRHQHLDKDAHSQEQSAAQHCCTSRPSVSQFPHASAVKSHGPAGGLPAIRADHKEGTQGQRASCCRPCSGHCGNHWGSAHCCPPRVSERPMQPPCRLCVAPSLPHTVGSVGATHDAGVMVLAQMQQ